MQVRQVRVRAVRRSDLAFIGGYHGLVDLRVGEIARIRLTHRGTDGPYARRALRLCVQVKMEEAFA